MLGGLLGLWRAVEATSPGGRIITHTFDLALEAVAQKPSLWKQAIALAFIILGVLAVSALLLVGSYFLIHALIGLAS